MLPVLGSLVKKLMDEGRQTVKMWRYEGDKADEGEGGVSWRVGDRRDLKEMLSNGDLTAKL